MANDRLYYIPYSFISSGVLARLKPTACKVALALWAHDGPDGIFPTRPTLMKECNLSESVVDAAIAQIEAERVFEVIRKHRENNRYIPLDVSSRLDKTTTSASETRASESKALEPKALENEALLGLRKCDPTGPQKVRPQHKALNTKQRTQSKEEKSAAKAAPALRFAPGSSSASLESGQSEAHEQAVPSLNPSQAEVQRQDVPSPQQGTGTGTVIPTMAAAAPAGHPKRSSGKKATSAKLDPADEARALSGLDMMTQYLLFGVEGVRHPEGKDPDGNALLPSAYNWRQHGGTSEDPPLDKWTTQSWMGFYWLCVSRYRNNRTMPLILPDWGRLGKEVKSLKSRMKPWDLYRYIRFLADFFDDVRLAIGRAGQDLVLDERTINHGLVRGTADNMLALEPYALQTRLETLRAGRSHAA